MKVSRACFVLPGPYYYFRTSTYERVFRSTCIIELWESYGGRGLWHIPSGTGHAALLLIRPACTRRKRGLPSLVELPFRSSFGACAYERLAQPPPNRKVFNSLAIHQTGKASNQPPEWNVVMPPHAGTPVVRVVGDQ